MKATKGVKKNVKTDDVNQPLLWMGMMLVAGGYILIKTKRKENNE